jgi:plastocyanin
MLICVPRRFAAPHRPDAGAAQVEIDNMKRARVRSTMSVRFTAALAAATLIGSAIAVDQDVLVIKHEFVPSEVVVSPGDSINWIWMEGGHTITSGTNCMPDFEFFNVPISRREPTFTFTVPDDFEGTIPYFCLPHCDQGMVGSITVVPATSPADIAPPGGDGVVDAADLGVLLSQWGSCPVGEECIADIDPPEGNGVVDAADLGLMLASWS